MFSDVILNLTKRFYPKGRAFYISYGSVKEKVHKALAVSENQALIDATGILNSILPDNANFTTVDAANWERRLGLITNELVSLEDRKLAITRKYNHPGTIPARQHYLYVEGQLQAAGFDVYVFENRFLELGIWITKRPEELFAVALSSQSQHKDSLQHGQKQHGVAYNEKIANSIYPITDSVFDIGTNLRSTFFICGSTLGSISTIDANREIEFRQLVLKLKPAQTIAFLGVNFISNEATALVYENNSAIELEQNTENLIQE